MRFLRTMPSAKNNMYCAQTLKYYYDISQTMCPISSTNRPHVFPYCPHFVSTSWKSFPYSAHIVKIAFPYLTIVVFISPQCPPIWSQYCLLYFLLHPLPYHPTNRTNPSLITSPCCPLYLPYIVTYVVIHIISILSSISSLTSSSILLPIYSLSSAAIPSLIYFT